ncbi:hypothetical protein BGX34_003173 [Mortierella sp. NVP85]|nr:hypothetical protein BGX34_003173 [Mortierella sp. NVP85]
MAVQRGLVLLCLLPLAFARYDALVSGALFEGVNTASPDADAISVFKDYKNHADAVASILLTKAKESDFDPHDGIHTFPETYFSFLENAASFPAFYHQGREDEQYALRLKGGDNGQLLDEIADKYLQKPPSSSLPSYRDSADRGEKKESERGLRIRQAFRELIPVTVEKAEWKDWALSLVTIQKPLGSDNITFELAHVRLSISRDDRTGRAVIGPQEATLVKSSYSVMGRYISFYSNEIAKFIEKATVDEFLRAMTTRKHRKLVPVKEDSEGYRGFMQNHQQSQQESFRS